MALAKTARNPADAIRISRGCAVNFPRAKVSYGTRRTGMKYVSRFKPNLIQKVIGHHGILVLFRTHPGT